MTKITQLPVASTITDTGVFVVYDQGITKQLTWQTLRTGGLRGTQGNTGTQGVRGPIGPTGTVATINIGEVTISTSSAIANVSTRPVTGTAATYLLDFVVPKGEKGDPGAYVLPNATAGTLGGVIVGSGINVTAGTISVTPYTLPTASTSTLGGVKVGTSLSITNGVLDALPNPYTLATATTTVLGGVKIGAGVNITNGVISVTTGAFALQIATDAILGGVKIGANINTEVDGTISVNTPAAAALTGTTIASNVTASSITSLGNLLNLNIVGTTTLRQTTEVSTAISGATGVVVHDCSAGTIFVHSTPSGAFTPNFTNIALTANRVTSVAVLVQQGVTPRVPTAVQINGVLNTVRWQGGIAPTGNASKRDLLNFTLISSGTSIFTVLGSLASYG
jgi:hypothetical protein